MALAESATARLHPDTETRPFCPAALFFFFSANLAWSKPPNSSQTINRTIKPRLTTPNVLSKVTVSPIDVFWLTPPSELINRPPVHLALSPPHRGPLLLKVIMPSFHRPWLSDLVPMTLAAALPPT